MRCGMDMDTWRTPFNELLMNDGGFASGKGGGADKRSGSVASGIESGYGGGDFHQQWAQQQRASPELQGYDGGQGNGYTPVATNSNQLDNQYQRPQLQQHYQQQHRQYPTQPVQQYGDRSS